jgi:hypothetical protein
MSETKIVFNYGEIKDEHKEAASECANILENMNHPELAELIKKQFKIVENPKFDFHGHPFVKAAEQAEVFCSVQGFVSDNGVDYPIIGITDDVRKIINLYNCIKNDETE